MPAAPPLVFKIRLDGKGISLRRMSPPPPPPPQQSTGPVPIGTVVSTLPAGCVATAINGIEYFNCAPGVYYRAAFQSNNLVYVATQP